MVECDRSVRSGPRISFTLGFIARRRVERAAAAAVIVALAACLVNANGRVADEAARGAKLRKLVWEEQNRGAEYAGAFHRAVIYTGVLEERLARYEPGRLTDWHRDALRRARREAAEATAGD
jgi:hypothetical protein